MTPLEKKQAEYIEFLGKIVDDNAVFLYIHHIRATEEEIETGKRLRAEIAELQKQEEGKEYFEKVYIKSKDDLPKDGLIHVGSNNGFEELVYIENGLTKKPFRYDDEDNPVIKIDKINWYLKPIKL